MLHLRTSLLGLIAFGIASVASAQPLVLDIDPEQSQIQFGFGATLHHVDGGLRLQTGAIHLDSQTGIASGQVVADASSAKTGVERRDRKMHEKILESVQFPKITFVVERVDGTLNPIGRSEIQLHGTLDMHGVRRPAAILAVANVRHTDAGDRVDATGYFDVPYLEWGMPDPSVFLLRVSKEVHVTVKIAGTLHPESSAANP
jgi:polyisoprenoid-binding protein YceI